MEFVHQTPYPFAEFRHIEIYEQSNGTVRQFQVRQKLRLMNSLQFLHGLQFDNHFVLNQQINPIAAIQMHSTIFDGQSFLSFDFQTSLSQLVHKTRFMG